MIRPIALTGLVIYNLIFSLLEIREFANRGMNIPAPLIIYDDTKNEKEEPEKPEQYVKEGGQEEEIEMKEGGDNSY